MDHKAFRLNDSVNEVSGRKQTAVELIKFSFYPLIFSLMTDRVYVGLTFFKSSSLKRIWDTRVTCAQGEESYELVAI